MYIYVQIKFRLKILLFIILIKIILDYVVLGN